MIASRLPHGCAGRRGVLRLQRASSLARSSPPASWFGLPQEWAFAVTIVVIGLGLSVGRSSSVVLRKTQSPSESRPKTETKKPTSHPPTPPDPAPLSRLDRLRHGGVEAALAHAAEVAPDDVMTWHVPYAEFAAEQSDSFEFVRTLVKRNRGLGLAAAAAMPRDELIDMWSLAAIAHAQAEALLPVLEKFVASLPTPVASIVLGGLARGTRDGEELYALHETLIGIDPQASTAPLYAHIAPPPDDLFLWVETKDGRTAGFADIPSGNFRRENGTTVTLPEPYRIGTVTVTNAQFRAFDPTQSGDDSHPANEVSWYECMSFCRWLSQAYPWARGARLPAEAEWEHAARAGTTTKYWSGDSAEDLARAGWYEDNSGRKIHAVGMKDANPWGLYDVHGNVWEWCSDWYDALSRTDERAPAGPPTGVFRVLRGGGCWYSADWCRSANRNWYWPRRRFVNFGFRVVLPPARSSKLDY